MRSRRWLAAGVVAALLAGGTGCASDGQPRSDAMPATTSAAARDDSATLARAAARDFLDRYVDGDGRVVRTDQGGDTVGEAQSYGLLLAEVAGDDAAAERIWSWTDANLRRPDGLLDHRWADGAVTDDDSAADADLVTAWALLQADDPALRDDGRALAAALSSSSVVPVDAGPVLAAGAWATGEPATLNPSYWALPLLRDLADETGDPTWDHAADAAVSTVAGLTVDGDRLPPDWARADHGAVSPTPAPDGSAPEVQYSLDAQRTVVWFAADDAGDDLAARWHRRLRSDEPAGAIALRPDGSVLRPERHAVALVAAAAAADAAGDTGARDRLLDQAAAADADHPTYYGTAWVALGRALLTTDLVVDHEEAR